MKTFEERKAEVLRRSADSGTCFDHVHSQFAGSLLHSVRHINPSDAVCCQENLCTMWLTYAKMQKNFCRKPRIYDLSIEFSK